MPQQIEMQFRWRRHEMKEVIVAVTKAVILGYNTKDKLLAALPMFSTYRIALAIDALITSDMAESNLGVLCIHPDMQIVFELLKRKFMLPMSEEQAKSPAVCRYVINQLGAANPAGVETLLRANPVLVET
jgi:hypothetical protein